MADKPSKQASREVRPFFGREPLRSLREEMDDLINRFASDWDTGWLSREFAPSMDLSESEGAVEVSMDLPGVKPDEITVEVSGNTLRIHGERKEEKEEKKKSYHRVERRTGSFSRSVTLPCSVDENKVDANYRDGVLTVTLPKTEEAKTHKVKVTGE